jgi:hypothetical protein
MGKGNPRPGRGQLGPAQNRSSSLLVPWTFGGVVVATAANPTVLAPYFPWMLACAFVLILLERGYLGSSR